MLANDVFRVVHDYFGHAKDGNKFGATGEERAFMAHKQLYSPEAQKALAAETRGQNSWVNFGPHAAANKANPAATIYADQKAGLLPDWALKHVDELDSPLKYRAKALGKLAGKAIVPAAIATSIATAPTMDTAVMDLIVPGGVEGMGQHPEEEKLMLKEDSARKAYGNSDARKDYLMRLKKAL